MAITYIGTSTYHQIEPPVWSKDFYGLDECSVAYYGAADLEKAFITAQTAYQALTYDNQAGSTTTDTGMRLMKISSDGNKLLPTVTLQYKGCRSGTAPHYEATDDLTTQTATTSAVIPSGTSPASPNNDGAVITCVYEYYAARTTYKWITLSTPGSSPTYSTVRNSLDPLDSSRLKSMIYSGNKVDPDTNLPIPLALAEMIYVFNTFTRNVFVSSYEVHDAVPGYVWECSSTVDYLVKGTSA